MKRAVQEFVKQCDACQRHKAETVHPSGLLQPLPIPDQAVQFHGLCRGTTKWEIRHFRRG